MNYVQIPYVPNYTPAITSSPYPPQSRGEKATEIATQVLPAAMQIGLDGIRTAQLLQAGQATSQVATAGVSSSTAAAGTTAGAATSWASAASTTLGVVGGVLGAINLAVNWGRSTPSAGAASGAAVGATIGTFVGGPGIGTAIGAAIGMLGGALIGSLTAGKHRDQQARDAARMMLVQSNILDTNYGLALPDGSTFNMGLDGGPRPEFGGRRPFEVDHTSPLAAYAVAWMNPVVDLLFPGNEKLKTDFVGYFANAALSNATSLDGVRQNINFFLQKMGISDEQLAQAIIHRAQTGGLSPQLAQTYLNGIEERRNPNLVITAAAPEMAQDHTQVGS